MTAGVVSEMHPAHAAILARPRTDPPGVWLVARVPVTASYPCRCVLGTRCTTAVQDNDSARWCRCYGRTDVDRVPAHCCSRRKGYRYAPLAYA